MKEGIHSVDTYVVNKIKMGGGGADQQCFESAPALLAEFWTQPKVVHLQYVVEGCSCELTLIS